MTTAAPETTTAPAYRCAGCEHSSHVGPCPVSVGRQASLFGASVRVLCACEERSDATRPALPGFDL